MRCASGRVAGRGEGGSAAGEGTAPGQRRTSPAHRVGPAGLLTAAGVAAGAVSLLGFLGSLHWALDLLSHFRVQYLLVLAVTALLLAALRRWRPAALAAALAAVNLAAVLPLYLGGTAPVSASGPTLRAMLMNVNAHRGDPRRVADAVREFDPDILVLEEVSRRWLQDLAPALAGYAHSLAEPREDNFGIALFSRFAVTRSRIAWIGEARVPSVEAVIRTPGGPCTVLATHPLPPGGREYSRLRNDQLTALPAWVREAEPPVLLLGDLNVTPWSVYFRRLLRDSGLRDSVRGWGVQSTWPAFHPLLRIPIDHALHSSGVRILRRTVGPDVGSDHFPLIVDFAVGAPEREREGP